MAGVVPTRKPSSGRKQWTLHEGPRSSLKRLRNQLANDGCPESQVVLAKQLLDEPCQVSIENRENAQLGVYWLIKASEQGNLEATDLLRDCLRTGKGISEHNYLDVKTSITMTQDEKLARKAAREMFASLSNGGDYITSYQLQRHMLAIDRNKKQPKIIEEERQAAEPDYGHGEPHNGDVANNYDFDTESEEEPVDWSRRLDVENEKLTEDHLVAAAVDYSRGQLPIVNRALCLTDPDLKALDHIPYIQRSILHPLALLKILYYKLIRFVGRRVFFKRLFFVADFDVQIVALMLAYSFLNAGNALLLVPMVAYYATFLIMVVATFRMLQSERDFLDFRVWSGLFICYSGGGMNAADAESQFIRNNLKPYGHFFLALVVNLVVYPIIAEQWIPQSELTVVSFCLTFMSLAGFAPKKRGKMAPDALLLFSFAVNVLARYPYETDPVVAQGWRFLELKVPTFAGYIIGNGVEFCISFRLFFYAFIPLLLLRIASRDNWRGTYKALIPHCVTLSWLQVVVISSQGATMFGLIRGTLALVGLVLFLPLAGLTSVILPAAALAKWLLTSNTLYTLLLFLILMSVGLSLFWILAKRRYNRLVMALQIGFLLVALYIFTGNVLRSKSFSRAYGGEALPRETLSWEVYQKYCVEPAWEGENVAVAQLKCLPLINSPLHWNAYVADVKISSVTNARKRLIDLLPEPISGQLRCHYGDEIADGCEKTGAPLDDCAKFHEALRRSGRCTLARWNTYAFEITAKMQSGVWGRSVDAVLRLGDDFKNFTLRLRPDDAVWFKGALVENAVSACGGPGVRPHVLVEEIGCSGCRDATLKSAALARYGCKEAARDLLAGLKSLLGFLVGPVVVFK